MEQEGSFMWYRFASEAMAAEGEPDHRVTIDDLSAMENFMGGSE